MVRDPEHEALARLLSQPDFYPHRPSRVERIETHISQVFLAGSLVYKLKKPVTFDFLDFSTVSAREDACREEVRLNSRLAPDVYLGVVAVRRGADGVCHLGGDGDVVDWLVEMRRLPTELTLDALHREGRLNADHIRRLAQVLVDFYRSAPPLNLPPQHYRERYLSHVHSNRRELLAAGHHLPGRSVERVHGFQLQLLALQSEILDARIAGRRIVDGHGDLRPEHICLTEPIAIFDCIEFSPEFRCIDVADELAFLAAECDFLGADWVAPQLLAAYLQGSGDRVPAILWDFYKCYRACVRAKVAALRAQQLEGTAQEEAAAEARRHLAFADQYAAAWTRPLVLAVGGLAGSGKTTLATAVAETFGAELLRTDLIRQELFGAGPQEGQMDQGVYSAEGRARVYDEMFRRAGDLLANRVAVVLDGTFATRDMLQRATQIAAGPPGAFMAIECVCRPEIAKERIAARLAEGQDASEARPEVHDLQRGRWQDWPPDVPQIRVDTEQPLPNQLAQVLDALRANFASAAEGA